jgi:hypothetical protein
MIHASAGPLRVTAGNTSSPILSSIAASDHGALPTTDKLKQGPMLRGDRRRSRHCRQQLHALPCQRHHQPQAIIAQRFLPVGVAKYLAKRLDIGGKSRVTPPTVSPSIPVPEPAKQWAYILHFAVHKYHNTS